MKKKDVKIETKVGEGPGGQHRNKTASCVVATHLPTGISVKVDERNQHSNKRKALKQLEKKVEEHNQLKFAAKKKRRRDAAIKDTERVRTYDYSRGIVIDHRTGKTASLKNIIDKGKLELLK